MVSRVEEGENFLQKKIRGFYRAKLVKNNQAYIAKQDPSIVSTVKRLTPAKSGFITNDKKEYIEHYEKKKEALQDEEATGLLTEYEPDSFRI